MNIEDLGFDDWFAAQAAAFGSEDCVFARVTAVDHGSYLVRNGSKDVFAELSGRLSYEIDDPAGLPCVGDWAAVRYYNDDTEAVICGVLPRKTFLRRKTAGRNADIQMIAANIDTAFIVQSCLFDFNPNRLDRYLVMAADGHVEPAVILTKTDLVTPEESARKIAAAGTVAGAGVIAVSNITGTGLDEFRRMLLPGRTYCLLGSSGVGKTTLINSLMGREAFKTAEVSGTGEGTHTTSRRQLIVLDRGAMLIDTPGMRELGLVGEVGGPGFEEIADLAAGCRYADCTHECEPGCAVLAAMEKGELSRDRYSSFIKLRKESDHRLMSYPDRRKKDKEFGRFLKTAKERTRR